MTVEEVESFFKDFKKPTSASDAYHILEKLIICTASRCLTDKETRVYLDDSAASLYYVLGQRFKSISFIFPNLPSHSYGKHDVDRQKMADFYSNIIACRKVENDFVIPLFVF
ncbi:hypothetical protein G6F43_007502 [Rhizopus delemar]|nr:hypothetical protein G6F43_007502 [Rhizopus delemar]